MNIEELWEKARKGTEIVRGRVRGLQTFESTNVPYVFLAESCVNLGHTVVRKGRIMVEKPLILLPEDLPQFEGFDFEEDLDIPDRTLQTFFLMRGIRFPSLKYNNTVDTLDLDESSLAKTVEKYKKELEQKENVCTALILGPEDSWQFSILIYVVSLVGRCAQNDLIRILDKYKRIR